MPTVRPRHANNRKTTYRTAIPRTNPSDSGPMGDEQISGDSHMYAAEPVREPVSSYVLPPMPSMGLTDADPSIAAQEPSILSELLDAMLELAELLKSSE